MYTFGLFLGHMSALPDALETLDAEMVEERVPPPKPVQVPPLPRQQPQPRPVREVKAAVRPQPQTPPAPQPARETPASPAPSVEAPSSTTPVSLPDGAGLPLRNSASRDMGLPVFESRPSAPPASSTGSAITPPQFGAAYLNNPRPAYPPAARKMGMEGTVTLKVLVSREGKVLEMEVARSSGFEILDTAAREAVKGWRFVPARRGETAVDEWVQVPLVFRLTR